MRPRRRDLLLGAAAAPLALPSIAGAVPGRRSDRESLQELLGHEQALRLTYEAALERDAIDPELGAALLAHELEHVRGLKQTLRGAATGDRAAPDGLEAALRGRREFGRFALELESRAIEAYMEALGTIGAARLLQPLGAIMAAGAQHRVALRHALGDDLLGREGVQ